MSKKKKRQYVAEELAGEIERREAKLTSVLDAKNLVDLGNRQPEVVDRIRDLIEIGHTPSQIEWAVRRDNQHMWVESQFAKSVARALKAEDSQ